MAPVEPRLAPPTTPEAALRRALRAMLLAAERPLTQSVIVDALQAARDEEEWPYAVDAGAVAEALQALAGEWDGASGVELVSVAGGWRLRTAPDLAPLIRRLWPDRTTRLSAAALEALAVIAYRQPCTRNEVEEVRGVDCGGVVRSLLDRALVRVVGRKDEPGRPLLYGTTPEFLETFSLPDLKALPTLRDLAQLRAELAVRERGQLPPPPPADATPDSAPLAAPVQGEQSLAAPDAFDESEESDESGESGEIE